MSKKTSSFSAQLCMKCLEQEEKHLPPTLHATRGKHGCMPSVAHKSA